VAFGRPPDAGIAAHPTDGVQVSRQQQGARSQARRCQRRLDTGVPPSDYNYIVFLAQHHFFWVPSDRLVLNYATPMG
jgi:hypothetical protein